MKKIIVCVIIFLISVSIISGCLPGTGNSRIKKQLDSPFGHTLDDQVAESISGYGYAFLSSDNKGGDFC